MTPLPINAAEEKFGARTIDRFYSKMHISKRYFFEESPCYLWRAAKSRGGLRKWIQKNQYGNFHVTMPWTPGQLVTPGARIHPRTCTMDVTYKVHRFAWEVVNGPIPPGMEPNHRCTRTLCVNTRHMNLLTKSANVAECNSRRNRNKRKKV